MAVRVKDQQGYAKQARYLGECKRIGSLRFYLSERKDRADRGARDPS